MQERLQKLNEYENSIKAALKKLDKLVAKIPSLMSRLPLQEDGYVDITILAEKGIQQKDYSKLIAYLVEVEANIQILTRAAFNLADFTNFCERSQENPRYNIFYDYYKDLTIQSDESQFDPSAKNSEIIIQAYGNLNAKASDTGAAIGGTDRGHQAAASAINAIGREKLPNPPKRLAAINLAADAMSKLQYLKVSLDQIKSLRENETEDDQSRIISNGTTGVFVPLKELQSTFRESLTQVQDVQRVERIHEARQDPKKLKSILSPGFFTRISSKFIDLTASDIVLLLTPEKGQQSINDSTIKRIFEPGFFTRAFQKDCRDLLGRDRAVIQQLFSLNDQRINRYLATDARFMQYLDLDQVALIYHKLDKRPRDLFAPSDQRVALKLMKSIFGLGQSQTALKAALDHDDSAHETGVRHRSRTPSQTEQQKPKDWARNWKIGQENLAWFNSNESGFFASKDNTQPSKDNTDIQTQAEIQSKPNSLFK